MTNNSWMVQGCCLVLRQGTVYSLIDFVLQIVCGIKYMCGTGLEVRLKICFIFCSISDLLWGILKQTISACLSSLSYCSDRISQRYFIYFCSVQFRPVTFSIGYRQYIKMGLVFPSWLLFIIIDILNYFIFMLTYTYIVMYIGGTEALDTNPSNIRLVFLTLEDQ